MSSASTPGIPATPGTPGSPAPAAGGTPRATKDRRLIGIKVGTVVSDKRDKTRTVVVNFQVRHPKYGKYLRRQSRFHVHDQANQSKLGDRVEIVNCRPLSKTKNWRLVRVVEKAVGTLEHVTEVQTA